MFSDSLSDLSTQTSQTGETRLDLDVDEILSTFEAQLDRATLAIPGSNTEVWETLTSQICLVAFHKCADFPSENMMAEMGVTRALLYYANIAIQPDFIPCQPHDERWRTISKIIGYVAPKKRRPSSSSSPCIIIPDVGTFSHNHHPRHTLEYLFRDHTRERPESGSDESKLLDLFGSSGRKLRAPVTYPYPLEVSHPDLGQGALDSKRGRGRPRGSTNKPVALSSQDAHEQGHRSASISKGPVPAAAADQSPRKRDFDNSGLHEPPSTDGSQWGSGRPKRQKVQPKVLLPSSQISSSSPKKKAPSGKRKGAKAQQKPTPSSAHDEPERVQGNKASAAVVVKFIKIEPKEAAKGTNGVLRKRRGRPPKAKSGAGESSINQTTTLEDTQQAERVVASSSQDNTTSSSPSAPNSTVSSEDYNRPEEPTIVLGERPHAYYSPTSSSDSPVPVSELPLAIRRKYAVAAAKKGPGVTSQHQAEADKDMSISASSRDSHK